jgi:hypothetical protein
MALVVLGSWLESTPVLVLATATALVSVALNAEFLRTIHAVDGVGRAVASVPVLAAELFVVGAGTAVGMLGYVLGRRY